MALTQQQRDEAHKAYKDVIAVLNKHHPSAEQTMTILGQIFWQVVEHSDDAIAHQLADDFAATMHDHIRRKRAGSKR